jgi:hypothetical protein
MRKLPPLTELRAFEAAARCLSFRLAAVELGVTPTRSAIKSGCWKPIAVNPCFADCLAPLR